MKDGACAHTAKVTVKAKVSFAQNERTVGICKVAFGLMPFPRKQNHVRQASDTLLPASDERKNAKKLMKHSDPRMLLHHPVLAMQHVVDGFKKPEKIKKQ